MSNLDKFAAAINCIDGRVQAPVAEWLKLHAQVQYVDMITEPGVDKVLTAGGIRQTASIAEKLKISIDAHGTSTVAVVGHFDCAANPVSFEEHKTQIEECVNTIRSWADNLRVIGLYVNEWSAVDVIYDSDSEFEEMNSYL
ncbi:MAG: hypothetical protein HKN25_01465 [Pyrinomonadaceae bacterium]|nr:hypothetical protein [Pyrinomonadaceae bacterium]